MRELGRGVTVEASSDILEVLEAFTRARTVDRAVAALPGHDERALRKTIEQLAGAGFLLPENEARKRTSRIAAWKTNVASAHYFVASRDMRYLSRPSDIETFLRARAAANPRPSRFKSYDVPVRRPLDTSLPAPGPKLSELQRVLLARQTVREFSRRPVAMADLAEIVRWTWGQTGTLDAGAAGTLTTKTSPSAGGLHPIECYVLAWNVKGLSPGLYHYDVPSDGLRLLRAGDFRREAVRAASGQTWVGRAAFLCVMTAVFARTLWKYDLENAFRVLWMDAGHLAQTFALMATERGLGPFQTAALQDTFIEALLGLDGVKEFPVYLCGAGVPVRRVPAHA